MEATKEIKKEVAVIDMLCDQCQAEIRAGEAFFILVEKGQVLCADCKVLLEK